MYSGQGIGLKLFPFSYYKRSVEARGAMLPKRHGDYPPLRRTEYGDYHT